jgi:hypothetical protein
MKKLLTGLCVAGGLLAGVNAASADMCSSDPRDAAENQNCGLDTNAAWTFVPSLLGSLNSPGRTPSDNIVSYSLSGAYFDNFQTAGDTETLSGTWTVDYTTMTVTAVSLTATGTDTLTFGASGAQIGATGGGGKVEYQLNVETSGGVYSFLNYETSPALTMIEDSFNGNSTNLHITSSNYSPLDTSDPGQLTQIPEPASSVLLGTALAGLSGFMAFRGRRKSAA